MRRAMRACPVSDRCLACDSSSRVLSRGNATAAAAPNAAMIIASFIRHLCPPFTGCTLQTDEDAFGICAPKPGWSQFPAHQPHSTPRVDAVHGVVQRDQATARARSGDRDLA